MHSAQGFFSSDERREEIRQRHEKKGVGSEPSGLLALFPDEPVLQTWRQRQDTGWNESATGRLAGRAV